MQKHHYDRSGLPPGLKPAVRLLTLGTFTPEMSQARFLISRVREGRGKLRKLLSKR